MRRIVFLFAATLVFAICTTPAHADELRLIAGGWSYHFVNANTRSWLNQNQDTLGLEYQHREWIFQAVHMRDSFGCSAWQIAAARSFPLVHAGGWFEFGLSAAGLAAYRCTSFPHRVVYFKSADRINVRQRYPAEYAWNRNGWGYAIALHCRACASSAPRKWVLGVVPGVYVNIGNRVRIEAALIYSPWSHRLIAYAQLSLLLYQWGGGQP